VKRTEFIVPSRPLSVQTKDCDRLQAWKQFVVLFAIDAWTDPVVSSGDIQLTIVFLCDFDAPIDVDNIVKPIQDALLHVVYSDDVLVTDVDSHRRYLQEEHSLAGCSRKLIELLAGDEEAVYIRVQRAQRPIGRHV
jgi:crossover junction endodeoxyribonuclease RusA